MARIEFQTPSADKKKGLDFLSVKRTDHICAGEFSYSVVDAKGIRRDREDLRIVGMAEVHFDPLHVAEAVSEAPENPPRVCGRQCDGAEGTGRSLAEDAGEAKAGVKAPFVLRQREGSKHKNGY